MKRIEKIILLMLFVFAGAKAQRLDTLKVNYVDPEGKTQAGTIICNHLITDKLQRIFRGLYEAHYPIASIRPISDFNNDDELSMEANNTSCYCYRTIKGSQRRSKHSLGLAVDLNPLWNPCVQYYPNGKVKNIQPKTAKSDKHSIDHNNLAYRLFRKEGFFWGGDWYKHHKKDYQHFEYKQ